ncbi:MAG: hypothetical protein MUC96_05570 [Myxococcaceae bacterium]|jgi:hypothetical protein|nr:hypothetical protein [Myxococcaceae bacterium]
MADRLTRIEPGLVVVRYATREDLAPTHQYGLLELLDELALDGPVAVVFDVPSMMVDASVPNFWLDVVKTRPTLVAMAIASPSAPVRLAAESFSLALRLRRHPLKVRTFLTVNEALEWATAARQAAASGAQHGPTQNAAAR